MCKKIRTMVLMVAMAIGMLTAGMMPVLANVDPTWEESQETQEETVAEETVVPESEEVPPEETPPAEATEEQAFSTPGNGDLGDEIASGMKDFYTIHTKNNNTFYLVVDHAGSQDNVYMLSLIDEKDLAEFLEETMTEPETEKPVVVVPEITPEPETQPVVTQEPEEKPQPAGTNFISLIILAVIGGAAALYYFKVYKPKKNADTWESEGMETGDGLDTENEDEDA